MVSPVRGLRPVVAARLLTPNVPKPTRRTSSPLFKALETELIKASKALAESVLVKPVSAAMLAISSFFFFY